MCEIDASDVIAIGSAFIACLAALYARWAALAAQKANNIAMQNERLKIYKALLNHHATLASRGPEFPDESLWVFYDAVQLSEFYFGEEIFKQLDGILENSFEIKSKVGLFEATKEAGREEFSKLVTETHLLHRKTRDACLKVADNMKPKLKIGAENQKII